MPTESTVVSTAIWVAILEGYSEIELYGVENNQFKDLQVGDDNTVYITERHFDGERLNTIKRDYDGKSAPIHYFLNTVCGMLRSHYILNQFADYMGIKVYNGTSGSMIDSYIRKKTLE